MGKGGNFLLNVGPDGNGEFPPESVNILKALGEWMSINGESIYGCGKAYLPKPELGRYTQNGNSLYLHLYENSLGPLPLIGVGKHEIQKAVLLQDKREIRISTSWVHSDYHDITFLDLGDNPILPDPVDTVIKIVLKGDKLMLSSQTKKYARECYMESQKGFGSLKSQIEENMSRICGDERTLMELCYGTLPSGDIGSVDFDTLRSYAAHAMLLYNRYETVRNLPEDIFLHFVFYPRINSESLVDCRSFFYNQLKHVLDISDASERVLAVNRWCAAQMTYESSDGRTESPMAAYYSGYGRCGEESVFAVTALRSIGIPARQVYVPWWGHCDDNHAWVEVYVDGKWRFLGACEPEPVLDRGWFTAAASRATLVHSRTFFDYGLKDEEVIGNQGICLLYNRTSRYAETGTAGITVRYGDERPAEGARVSFQVINMAGMAQIAEVITDNCGGASLNMGCGSVHAEAFLDGTYGEADIIVKAGTITEGIITLNNELPSNQVSELDFIAPAASSRSMSIVTGAQQRENRGIIAQAKDKRDKKLQSYWKEEYDGYPKDIREMLHLAGGNAEEIKAFYDEKPEDLKKLAKLLLKALSKKDYKDVKADILDKHFYGALSLDVQHDEMFVPYVMCPRIGYETLEGWRDTINKAFIDEEKRLFCSEPSYLMEYINKHYREGEGRYYDALTMTPYAVLALGMGDEKARNVLFIAIMRTLGVPSRLSPYDGRAEYFRDGSFHRAADEHKRDYVIELVQEEGKRLVYGSSFTLAKWGERGYELLNCTGESSDNIYKMPVCTGHYRLITTNRLPNGNQLVRITHFNVDESAGRAGAEVSLYGDVVEDDGNCVRRAGAEASPYGKAVEDDDNCVKRAGTEASPYDEAVKYGGNCVMREGTEALPYGEAVEYGGNCVMREGTEALPYGKAVEDDVNCVKRAGTEASPYGKAVEDDGNCVKRAGTEASPYDEAVEDDDNCVKRAGAEASPYGEAVEYGGNCVCADGDSIYCEEQKYTDNCRGRSSYRPEDTHIIKIPLVLRTAKTEDMLENNPLHPFELKDEKENVIIQDSRRIIAYLDLGTEPTEHVLNELVECSEALECEMLRGLQVILVLRCPHENNNPTLSKVINKLPHIILAYDDSDDNPDTLARAMYLEPGKWPLVLLLDSRGYGRYGSCGYSVGLVELTLKLTRLIDYIIS